MLDDFSCTDCGDDTTCVDCEVRENEIKKLMMRWNTINQELEQGQWMSEEEVNAEADYMAGLIADRAYVIFTQRHPNHDDLPKDEQDRLYEAVQQEVSDKEDAERQRRSDAKWAELRLIENMLGQLHARVARPYEHWNEDEKLMEYLERDR
jgi:hypothetical protein